MYLSTDSKLSLKDRGFVIGVQLQFKLVQFYWWGGGGGGGGGGRTLKLDLHKLWEAKRNSKR